MAVLDRVLNFFSSEHARALHLAHHTYKKGIEEHGGRTKALAESLHEVCNHHPDLLAGAAGGFVFVLSRAFLAAVNRDWEHGAEKATAAVVDNAAPIIDNATSKFVTPADEASRETGLNHPHSNRFHIKRSKIKPFLLSAEAFVALEAVKTWVFFSDLWTRREHRHGPLHTIAEIRSLSAVIGIYATAWTIKSRHISALRNAAVAGFSTYALKPLLEHDPKARRPKAGTMVAVTSKAPATAG